MTRNRGVNMLQDQFRQWESRRDARRNRRNDEARSERRKKMDGEARRLGFVLVKRDVYLQLQRELFELRDFKLKANLKEAGVRLPAGTVVISDENRKAIPYWPSTWARPNSDSQSD